MEENKAANLHQLKIEKIVAYQEIFSSPKGKRVFNDLLHKVNYFGTDCDLNANAMYYKQGRKDVVNDIIQMLDQDPSKLLEDFRKYTKEQRDYEEHN